MLTEAIKGYGKVCVWLDLLLLPGEPDPDGFLWQSKAKPGYTNWAPGEPKDQALNVNGHNCVINSYGYWRTEDCNAKRLILCKKKLVDSKNKALKLETKPYILLYLKSVLQLVACPMTSLGSGKTSSMGLAISKLVRETGLKERNIAMACRLTRSQCTVRKRIT